MLKDLAIGILGGLITPMIAKWLKSKFTNINSSTYKQIGDFNFINVKRQFFIFFLIAIISIIIYILDFKTSSQIFRISILVIAFSSLTFCYYAFENLCIIIEDKFGNS